VVCSFQKCSLKGENTMRQEQRKKLALLLVGIVTLTVLSTSSLNAEPVPLSDEELATFVGGWCCCRCQDKEPGIFYIDPIACDPNYGLERCCPVGDTVPHLIVDQRCRFVNKDFIGYCLELWSTEFLRIYSTCQTPWPNCTVEEECIELVSAWDISYIYCIPDSMGVWCSCNNMPEWC